jgi:hypothetical protein
VRIGAAATEISGHFEYEPPADGAYFTRLVPPPNFPDGTLLTVSQGAIPAILLMDTGRRDVTVIGLQGEDEVRIGNEGVAVNTGSFTWRHWGQEERSALDAQPGRWLKVSQGAAYLWLEPRGMTQATGEAHPDVRWSLPLRVDGTVYDVQGIAIWRESAHGEVAAR